MAFGKTEETMEQKEKHLEEVQIDDEILSYESSIAEKRAIIMELKKRHGPKWKQILGLNGRLTLADLRSSLQKARRGLEAESHQNRRLSPIVGRPGAGRDEDPAHRLRQASRDRDPKDLRRPGPDPTEDLRQRLSPLAPDSLRRA